MRHDTHASCGTPTPDKPRRPADRGTDADELTMPQEDDPADLGQVT